MATKTIQIPETLFRSAEINKSADEADFSMSVSSDEPYKRYDWRSEEEYWEVLDHSPGGVSDARLKAGLPILFNHDRNQHLGRATEYVIDGKKCTVSKLIWSDSEFAQTKKKDAISGALPDTSVGYRIIDDGVCIGEKDGLPIYKFKWEIHEASLVTIPADITVGAGRSASGGERFREINISETNQTLDKTKQNQLMQPTGDKPVQQKTTTMLKNHTKRFHEKPDDNGGTAVIDVVKERGDAVADFRKRCNKINEFVDGLKNPQWRESATAIAKKHTSGDADFDAFRAEALDSFESVQRIAESNPNIGMSQKEAGQFSLMRAARQIIGKGRLEGLEKEASEAAAKHLGRTLREGAICMPNEVATLDLARALNLDTRAQNVTTFTAGGALVQNQYGPMIELLNNATVLGKLGITTMNGIVGDMILPQQTGGATAYWVSETGALTDSQATFAQKAMTPHRCGATIPFTTQFLAQSSISAEAFLRGELMTRLALLQDLAGLEGTGVSGQPLGVKNTSGINSTVTFGGAATWDDIVEFETGITVDNADIGTMGFALSSATVGKWKTILRSTTAGAVYLIDKGDLNGYGYERTNQITGNIAFFGVWSQLLLARWAGMEFIVDPYALKKSGQIEITVNQLCDYLVRQPLAFNVSTDSAAQ